MIDYQLVFRRLLPLIGRKLSGLERATLAAEFGVSASTVSRWMRKLKEKPFASALESRPKGPQSGHSNLPDHIVRVMDEIIDQYFLTKNKPRVSKVYGDLVERCESDGLHVPGESTFRRRIKKLKKSIVQKGRMYASERNSKYSPKTTHYKTSRPMEIVQIDHTVLNAIIIDSVNGEPLGRPNITVATDIYTRMVIGVHIGLFKPRSETVGQTLGLACFDKAEYLASTGLSGIWPNLGLPETLHMDNAGEFKSADLKNACGEYGIERSYRPVGGPHYGGHVESVIDTINENLRNIPGATYRNVEERGGYPAERLACFTLPLLKKHIINFIINHYHIREHSSLFGMSPKQKLDEAIQKGFKPRLVPKTKDEFIVDFCTSFPRKVRRIGIEFECKEYWSSQLAHLLDNNVQVVKVIPFEQSIRAIRILTPNGEIKHVPIKDREIPDMTRSEWKRYRKVVRDRHRQNGMSNAELANYIRIEREIELDAKRNAKHIRKSNEARLLDPLPDISDNDNSDDISGMISFDPNAAFPTKLGDKDVG